MTRSPLDPRICPIAIDANALNRDGSASDQLVDRLLQLSTSGAINLITPKGVHQEILAPQTPAHIQAAASVMIFTRSVELNPDEQRRLSVIKKELQGNARPGKHEADVDHLFEAGKYCGYFITHDKRILARESKIRNELPPSLSVVTLAEFLKIFDDFESRRRL